jgi:tRNA modification GTPase
VVVWVVDAADPDESPPVAAANLIVVRNKIDLLAKDSGRKMPAGHFAVSSVTGEGLEALLKALAAFAEEVLGSREPALVTRERQRLLLQEASDALVRAIGETQREDIFAEELRLAARALGPPHRAVDIEDVLDVIFRDFCIGK